MCDQPKIHVFLGAPPASSSWTTVSGAGTEEQKPPPVTWRLLELTWQDGHLKPLTDYGGNGERRSLEEDGAVQSVQSSESRHYEALSQQSDPSSEGQTRSDGPDPGGHLHCSASVHEYLESCFSAELQQPPKAETPRPKPQKTEPVRLEPLQPVLQKPEPRGLLESEPQSLSAIPPLSTRAQYLSTWTLSQALFLRGRCCNIQSASTPEKTPPPHTPSKPTETPPSASSSTPELFSPETSSPGASAELFGQPCPTPRAEEGGVVIEVTEEGVLCSQGAGQQVSKNPPSPPCISPQAKKVCIPEEPGTKVSAGPSDSTVAATRPRGQFTLLTKCDRQGSRYSVLVAVVHPCYLKEVKVKSGPAAGTAVPLASIVVTDQSGVEMKVVLWRRAAFWVLTVSPGDILLLTGLQVNEDRWRGETILQSTYSSKLLNLGPATLSTPPPASQLIDAHSLSSLYGFLRERRPLLVSLNCRPPQDFNRLPYAALKSLRVNTLVHALLRITLTHLSTAWSSGAESRCRAALQTKVVLTVEQPGGHQGALLLWGAAVDWLPLINRDRGGFDF
ncbi:shieldin complex subunit 2 isoform X1 [Xyrichtys novacula]|uniref:Shieldin complex subunit 2 isoform X1 n=1 Tax=Xyrichtys novacula TaxID=13765 RepID=A0AAV1G236_XYRNO|nr:shieldin complex subunit 2 isoform X1 [Xyrichtys novacula]